ncbi:MAG: hypothetical protein AB7H80_07545 [Candidatus Kapaibacterium sp.]
MKHKTFFRLEGVECTSRDVGTSGSAAPSGRSIYKANHFHEVQPTAFLTATQHSSLREQLVQPVTTILLSLYLG